MHIICVTIEYNFFLCISKFLHVHINSSPYYIDKWRFQCQQWRPFERTLAAQNFTLI